LHADPPLTARAATAAGVAINDIDGIALEFYPEPNSAMIQSETQMIDFGRGGIVGYSPPT
jgi:hypothetical protein